MAERFPVTNLSVAKLYIARTVERRVFGNKLFFHCRRAGDHLENRTGEIGVADTFVAPLLLKRLLLRLALLRAGR